jgi:hypothetical protein
MSETLIIAELCLKYGPSLARAFQEIFTKENPTKEDWDKVWAAADTPFEDFFKKPLPTASENPTKS